MTNKLPPLPPDHPLTPYSVYMVNSVQEMYLIMVVLATAVVCIAAAFCVFAYQKYWERKELGALKAETTALLAVIKGWHLIVAEGEKEKKEKLNSVEVAVSKVPDITAKKVLDGMDQKTDSGILKKENP